MSMRYYGIEGYGINCTRLIDSIDKDKLVAFLKEQNVYREGADSIVDYVYDDYDSVAEVFSNAGSPKITLDYCDNECNSYLYIPALLPWHIRRTEMDMTPEDVEDAILECVSKLTNLSPDEIISRIEYIDDVYLG